MIGDINTFRSANPDGWARPSKFEVYFPAVPTVAADVNVANTLFKAQAATIPQSRLSAIDVYYQGRPIPTVGERSFVPWTVRFYNDITYGLRDFFEAWSNRANTLVGNQTELTDLMAGLSGGYAVDGVIVRQFSQMNVLLRSYEFFGMFPEVVGDIELNWEAANRIETFDVQFRYAYWIPSISDTDQQYPGTYDYEGSGANVAPGAITSTGAQLANPSAIQSNITAATPTVLPIN